MTNLAWLERLKKSFASTGLSYEDLYELITASIARGKTSFPALIYDASKGGGFSVSEGFFTLLIKTGMIPRISMRSVFSWVKWKPQAFQCPTMYS